MTVKLTDLNVSNYADFDRHERVVLIEDTISDLTALVSIHNNNLGPAMGGCRFYNYKNRDAGITDVLRLSRGMTYKSALVNLPLGGGKSVIFGDAKTDKTQDKLKSFGEGLEKLKGAYITAEDVGTTEGDMLTMATQTSNVMGLPATDDNPLSGNPSPYTSQGVFTALEGVSNKVHDTVESLKAKRCGVLGLGAVGYGVAQKLNAVGAKLYVADINTHVLDKAREEFSNVTVLTPEELLKIEQDAFVPCALGGVLNSETIANLKTEIICGAANNQLAKDRQDDRNIFNAGMIYVPDYVTNAGGIIAIAYAYFYATKQNPYGWKLNKDTLNVHVESIRQTALQIFNQSTEENRPTGMIADQMAEDIFLRGAKLKLAIL